MGSDQAAKAAHCQTKLQRGLPWVSTLEDLFILELAGEERGFQ